MRIVIDMQGAQSGSRTRGIGRYSLSLAQAIARNHEGHEVVLALNGLFAETIEPLRQAFSGLLPQENIQVWEAPGPVRASDSYNQRRRRRAEVVREAFLASLSPDIVHITSLFEGFGDDAVTSIRTFSKAVPTSLTLFDLIPLHDPDRFLAPHPFMKSWYLEKLEQLKQADLLLAISDYSVRDAKKRLGAKIQRIVNISTACSEIFVPKQLSEVERHGLLSRLGISGPFVMTSGTIEPHKNLERLFKAFACLPAKLRSERRLVLIGKTEPSQRPILQAMRRRAGLSVKDLVVTGHVSDDDLVALYNSCELMVFPSLDEGFGLPALEAMACGAPTIGSRAASIPEVIGCDDAMFDPLDADDMTRVMTRAIMDENYRAELKALALERAPEFSWDKTARCALGEMEALIRERSNYGTEGYDIVSSCIEHLAGGELEQGEALQLAQSLARTFPARDHKRQLLIDVSELCRRDARTGCQRVTRSILLQWLKNSPGDIQIEPVYATLHEQGYRYARRFATGLSGRPSAGADDPIDYASGDIFFGLDYHADTAPTQMSSLMDMRLHGVSVHFLVYDILPVTKPSYFPLGTDSAFSRWLEAVGHFDGIIGISKTTTEAVQAWYADSEFSLSPDYRFSWVHLGADIENSAPTFGLPSDADELFFQLRQRPTFLMVGTIEPRKGYAQALAAFDVLWTEKTDCNLIIVGKEGWGTKKLVAKLRLHPEHNNRFFWLEGASDEYLNKIYASASCLLAASEAEGFGLPLIEAARQKVPILARDISVFREVAGVHAGYFSGSKPIDLAESIKKWLALYRENRHPKSDGLPWTTWEQSAKQMWAELLSRGRTSWRSHERSGANKVVLHR